MIILILLVNVFEMIYELVASRAISPFYGDGNYTMTAVIAVMLLSGSLGNLIGGKLTQHKRKYLVLEILFGISSVLTILSISAISLAAPILNGIFTDLRFSISIISLLFFIPALIMGIFTPVAMDDILSRYPKEKIGEVNGKIHAVIAVGSLSGTVLGGFVLIPAFGTNKIFAILALFMLSVAIYYMILYGKEDPKKLLQFAVPALLILIFDVQRILKLDDVKAFAYSDKIQNELSFDTEYGRIMVYDTENNDGDMIRMYKQGDFYASATYIDESRKYEPVFDYIKTYDLSQDYTNIENTLMLGGAAYQYPKHFISTYTDQTMDVVEINGASTDIARKYFYLDDLEDEYGTERINCITADGRVFLDQTDRIYNAIYNDTFSGGSAVATLSTVEFAQILKSKLAPNGVYMSNLIGPIYGRYGLFIRSEAKTLMQVFKYVYILPVRETFDTAKTDNWILVATDNPYRPKNAFDIALESEDYVLTDDYCPVELLSNFAVNRSIDQ